MRNRLILKKNSFVITAIIRNLFLVRMKVQRNYYSLDNKEKPVNWEGLHL